MQHVEPVGEREGHAFEHGLADRRGVGIVVETEQHATRRRVVVRRALTRQVRQEDLGAVEAPRASRPSTSSSAASFAPVSFTAQSTQEAADSITLIWCQTPGQAVAEGVHGLGRDSAGISA